MSTPALPNAGWPPHALMRRLERSGRGEFRDPQFRGTMAALTHLANAIQDDRQRGRKSRDGARITVYQLAERSGYSTKWVQTSLKYLEELGLVVWVRGRIEHGKPKPSWITIQRQRLVALVRDAMGIGDKRDAEHCESIREKIRKLGSPRFMQSAPSRRSSHVEAASTPRPLGGLRPSPSGKAKREPLTERGTHRAVWEAFLPSECPGQITRPGHDAYSCRHCKSLAISEALATPASSDGVSTQPSNPAGSSSVSVGQPVGVRL